MRSSSRFARAAIAAATTMAAAAATVAAFVAGAGPAAAATAARPFGSPGAHDAVFVQTDNTAGNEIVAYHRAADGTLTQAGTYATGGLGGQLSGSVVDHLASQGSLTYDPNHALLFAVNAGSNTLSVFGVTGDALSLRQVIGSGGQFPVSVAVHGDLVYVANALNGGSVQGYRVAFDHLIPIAGSGRPLGLNPGLTPQFTNTPGQVAFTAGGSQLIVTTKANGNDVDVFGVLPSGRLSAAAVVNPEPGTTPFAVDFDESGHVVIAEAGTNALATFALTGAGQLIPLSTIADGQAALCWVARAGALLFADNAGSATTSGYSVTSSGQLTLIGSTATDPGTVDASASGDGQFLYVQTGGNGVVDAYAVAQNGSLTPLGGVTVPDAVGGEGIVAQ